MDLETQNIHISQDIQKLNLMPLRDIVVFPGMVIPLFVGRPFSVRAIEDAFKHNKLMFFVLQKDRDQEEPKSLNELHKIGTIVKILRAVPLEDGRLKILAQGLEKGELKALEKVNNIYIADVLPIKEEIIKIDDLPPKEKAYVNSIKDLIEKAVNLGKQIIPDFVAIVRETEELDKFLDLVASILDLKAQDAQSILEITDLKKKLVKIHDLLLSEVGILELQNRIKTSAREKMEKEQKEYYLRQQMKAIQEELGESDDRQAEVKEYLEKLKKLKAPKSVKEDIEKQINRLSKMYPESAESTVIRTWLDWIFELPWNKKTKDIFDIEKAQKLLDKDHYDLEKIKERIIEYLSVRKLTKGKGSKSTILCFIGPPGVGKTSLGQSIAKATGRKFVRISLGGIRDEAEIRGHRRTYVGAMPGRIIQAIKQAGVKNPLIMLDEIDKLSVSFQGDPAAALLEVLDPEQNKSFTDLYIGHPFDLSEVLFVATGNRVDTIPQPLLDRMEVLYLSGYSEEEKLHIAKNHLLPTIIKDHGFKESEVIIEDEAILEVIRSYTREAGVRNLKQKLASLLRKLAVKKLKGQKPPFVINKNAVKELLGVPRIIREKEELEQAIGLVTGLAWTEVGGEIMYIEVTKLKGRGSLILTGSLGDVMKESAQAALSYIKSKADQYGIDSSLFSKYDIHIHVPEGAVPKDGPSAGIAIATGILSIFTEKPVRLDVAMTGEVTLRGRVLPIGGVKEKILAAKRAGIYEVILPSKNKVEVMEDLPDYVKEKMQFHFVDHLDEVFKIVFKDNVVKQEPKKTSKSKKAKEKS
ncbi:MAG: endopeptidase La [Hydrogenobaculum sp.]